MCAAYDSPNFLDHLPGFAANSHDTGQTADGSDGTAWGGENTTANIVLADAYVSIPGASSVAPIPRVNVVAGDANVPGQVPAYEPFTHVGNTWRESTGHDDPNSHVASPGHPNSNGVNRA